MRRTVLIVCLAAIATAAVAEGQPSAWWPDAERTPDPQAVMAKRMVSLEAHFGITFPDSCRPMVRVGLPSSMPEPRRSTLSGVYSGDSTIIWLSEKTVEPYRTRDLSISLLSWLFAPTLNEVLDHELGHAYSDWTSRCTDGRRWPRIDSTSTVPVGLGLMIQSEGISQVFCRDLPDTAFSADWWPTTLPPWSLYPGGIENTILAYEGGYLLIGDLVRRFGMEPTVAYVVTHPLTVDPKRIRRCVTDWHRRAIRELQEITDTTE